MQQGNPKGASPILIGGVMLLTVSFVFKMTWLKVVAGIIIAIGVLHSLFK